MRFGVLRFARGLRMVQRSWSCLVSVRLRVIGCGRARPGMYRVRRVQAASVERSRRSRFSGVIGRASRLTQACLFATRLVWVQPPCTKVTISKVSVPLS